MVSVSASDGFSLPYHEPSTNAILILSSFLLALNVANWGLDKAVYCGLVGQILLGVIYGSPVASWLSLDLQTSIVQLGYIGLILLVYHGGLSTSLGPLIRNLPLSVAVALIGICVPIGLSFLLGSISEATPLQCFSAGAALSATSLGTTFTILSSAGFAGTRLGVVLTSAAMMDDVAGLVMVKVVSSLGSGGAVEPTTVARSVGVSTGLVVAAIGIGWIFRFFFVNTALPTSLRKDGVAWIIHSLVLATFVVISGYAGASVLLGAFVAGALTTWWDESRETKENSASDLLVLSGIKTYEKYYLPAVERVLIPFFFASIGFSIPVKRMFAGRIVWRGIVYSILMIFGKLITGIWILIADIPFNARKWIFGKSKEGSKSEPRRTRFVNSFKLNTTGRKKLEGAEKSQALPTPPDSPRPHNTACENAATSEDITPISPAADVNESKKLSAARTGNLASRSNQNAAPKPPLSIYPSMILGLAMVARGEIGFLIASIASANGIFTTTNEDGTSSKDDIFLIVIWAVVFCTILGPLGVGLLVKRVKSLENTRKQSGGKSVLGEWSVSTKNTG